MRLRDLFRQGAQAGRLHRDGFSLNVPKAADSNRQVKRTLVQGINIVGQVAQQIGEGLRDSA